ncbi:MULTISPECIES: hypothetical protein [Streptomycetaceae]|uniref:Uncharacterized protein n=1 Tax=Streptantibioticus cattleyicolor (strain ATCC 35852 / DSM 46488 / JCM 4925 / NBRC 14057 / NRRL 8057) TaxID=1003195 RepID=F8K023_STREN|nr:MULTISPECIES: hypothetical protein [Streptomycetaceae]AEW94797.1 hypothetical protein SCATT_24260 [Streptantibioticus cattleyicolor NRRL 8057 = DSM 46488]MYS59421.1 hypothetical protein [Streptomyces sp. SID5468]CCB75153.1 conserved protein of unknown function [Streptantibioticus cattleyicolor NRRL 8057 = DSM 46488]
MDLEPALHAARAHVLADLAAHGIADAAAVSLVEDAVAHRRWWAEQWPQGVAFVCGLVAQDVQEALLEQHGTRWPCCSSCHELLSVEPELGEDPRWVCENHGVAAAVGALH